MEHPVRRHSQCSWPLLFSCYLLLLQQLNAQLVNNIDGNGQPPAQANNFPQAPTAQLSNGPAAPSATSAPWSSFESWLGQVKQNVVQVVDKAGNEIGSFASSASQLIQNKTSEIGKDLEGLGKPKSENVSTTTTTAVIH